MSCHERCQMINLNPVVVAKHTSTELHLIFFTKAWLTNAKPTGKIVHFALRAKFLIAASTAGAVVLCKTKTLDMKPD